MRVRFAPSPTGFLHIGNARTAIINYLLAKSNNWKFILRIEDTDRERSTRESEQSILNDLSWLGIVWDEGPDKGGSYGPYRQSERFDIYREYTERLLEENNAYHCYCTPDEIETVRKKVEAENKPYECVNRCGEIGDDDKKKFELDGRKPAVRFRVSRGELITVKDYIKGNITFNSDNIGGDFIIVRSDGYPIYNYIVVLDDILMKVSHVIRGEDHLSNTPKQVLIHRALGIPVPEYAHHPLILGPDRAKLSKRHGITSVELYRKEGYLPEALVNYMALLGWATEDGAEILTFDEIVRQIDLKNIGKSASVFDFQKLRWMNGIYIRNYPVDSLVELFLPYITEAGFDPLAVEERHLKSIITAVRGSCEVLSDIKKVIGIFLSELNEPDEEADKMLKEDYSREIIILTEKLFSGSRINGENFIEGIITMIKEGTELKGKKLFMPVRAMLTGRLKGPEMDAAIPLIGFEKLRKRVEYCFNTYCRQ